MKKITVPIAVLALAFPAAAQAHRYQAHISMVRAEQAIIHWAGPGTVLTKCRRFAPDVVGCDFATSSINFGLVFEDEATGFKPESGTWYGYVNVRYRRGKLVIEEPEPPTWTSPTYPAEPSAG